MPLFIVHFSFVKMEAKNVWVGMVMKWVDIGFQPIFYVIHPLQVCFIFSVELLQACYRAMGK